MPLSPCLSQLNNINWIEFVEGASLVDQLLKKDPARVYEHMDFATRDHYRHAVERISKGSRATSEFDVAQLVVDMSNEVKKDDRAYRKNHIGYWLVGEGVAQLEHAVGYTPTHVTETAHHRQGYIHHLTTRQYTAHSPALYSGTCSDDRHSHHCSLPVSLTVLAALIAITPGSLTIIT